MEALRRSLDAVSDEKKKPAKAEIAACRRSAEGEGQRRRAKKNG